MSMETVISTHHCSKSLQALLLLVTVLVGPPAHGEPLPPISAALEGEGSVQTIAFGSCLRQGRPQPIWSAISALEPDLFLFIGDNVYADTKSEAKMRRIYQQLAAEPGYQQLRASTPIHATWDDHDYGANDAGADFPAKRMAERVFLDFFEIPADAPERQRPGIYASHLYGEPGQRVQLILLDTRYFRSPLRRGFPSLSCPRINNLPNRDPEATLLGAAQWAWLAEELRRPAQLRIIASSIQVVPEQHCFEKWANFPLERDRLFTLLQESRANGVILISGDRHLAEISRLPAEHIGYPLYEITSSGMNSAGAGHGEQNRHRLHADNFRRDNFAVIQIDWAPDPAELSLEIRDDKGRRVQSHRLRLDELQPEPSSRTDLR